ncbi:alpha-ketoglutarate-dependent dioxygenase AlkB [Mucilaginibacter sp. RS28]|uniref:Alpha-ketoglutarate-dependent dioxygenase AlkB n=1 Tax=Mucilaginibacter straminoryzae TaxID=2932774 RepID=A0A9X2BDC2_9SPHI|nr:alpha-ketoglutarate-dependent dioxygenase AlkB [Mucilaginibacter straminoryzae]MCJ8210183.1 alpha-ketoglutarate-dependent dioxygenase AlkB [Mucilaginibacter straminoryzae]
MQQLSFFADEGQSAGLPKEVLDYRPGLFNEKESSQYLETFISTVPWEQKVITLYDKQVVTPRLTAWFGDINKNYAYSGSSFHPLPWTEELLEIKARIEPIAGTQFNSVLLNYYRDGNDSVAWHSDNERELGQQPLIASVSFGQVRKFDIRHKQDHKRQYSVKLENGSLLLMKGELQQNWEHRIAKSTLPMQARVNLTFRIIKR